MNLNRSKYNMDFTKLPYLNIGLEPNEFEPTV